MNSRFTLTDEHVSSSDCITFGRSGGQHRPRHHPVPRQGMDE
ncbi:MAG: hypothetical protein WD060_07835 [Pirellulales bacterium]